MEVKMSQESPQNNKSRQAQDVNDTSIDNSEFQQIQTRDGIVTSIQGTGNTVTQKFYLDFGKRLKAKLAWRRLSWGDARIIFFSGIIIATLVMTARWQGQLQKYELQAFDVLLQQQAIQPPDSRILVIRVTPDDTKDLNQKDKKIGGHFYQSPEARGNGARTLSDDVLNKLIEKINRYNPLVIGLDLFREGKVSSQYQNLRSAFLNGSIIAACVGESTDSKQKMVVAPEDVPEEHIGFADLTFDKDDVVRRNLLAMRLESLSLKLALRYFHSKDVKRQDTKKDEFIKIGETKFLPLELHRGGYHDPESDVTDGIQSIINYRPYRKYDKDIAQSLSLKNIFNGGDGIRSKVEGKIILIGADDQDDLHKTPFSREDFSGKTPGVFVHAQLIGHIIDAVEGKRPLIWSWAWELDFGWILCWGFLGAGLASIISVSSIKGVINWGVFSIIGILSLYGVCWAVLYLKSGWIPLVPSMISFLWSALIVKVHALVSRIRL
jgi:CHASE2 domain-containing sensor protein